MAEANTQELSDLFPPVRPRAPERSLLVAHLEALIQTLDHETDPRRIEVALASVLDDHARGAYRCLTAPPWQIERALGVRTGSAGQRLGNPTAMEHAGDLRRLHLRTLEALVDLLGDNLVRLQSAPDDLMRGFLIRELLIGLVALLADLRQALSQFQADPQSPQPGAVRYLPARRADTRTARKA